MFKSVALLLAIATAATARKCHNLTIPISISAQNAVFNLETPTTEIAVTNFFLRLTQQGRSYADELQTGYTTVGGDYELAATYCEPDSGPGHALQIMTHGIGFDRSYWDLSFNNYNYSYVAKAVDDHGYSTFTWDRLGVGHSSKGEPINEIQVFLEIAALEELTTLLREGSICGIDAKYDRTVHIGHSFGSVMTYNLVNSNPNITDAIVLTGFSQIPNYMPYFALGGNFAPVTDIETLAWNYPAGYMAPRTSIGFQINFFAPDDFDPEMLTLATKTGQPATPGELLTVGAGTGKTNVFKGPVLIITGDKDVPFCGGDCTATSSIQGSSPDLIAASERFFPNAVVFNSTIVPGVGHSLNMGYTFPSIFESMQEFIGSHL